MRSSKDKQKIQDENLEVDQRSVFGKMCIRMLSYLIALLGFHRFHLGVHKFYVFSSVIDEAMPNRWALEATLEAQEIRSQKLFFEK